MQKTKLPSFVTVLILTLITAVMWVSFDVYRLFVKPVEPSVPESVSKPLTPTLDQDSINNLETQIFLNDSEIPDNVINSAITFQPLPTPTPEASPASQSQNPTSPTPTPENTTSPGPSI